MLSVTSSSPKSLRPMTDTKSKPDDTPYFELDLSIDDDRWDKQLDEGVFVLSEAILTIALAALSAANSLPDSDLEVSVCLTNDDAIQDLNKKYRDKDKPTNVLSFPQYDDAEHGMAAMLGDIVLSYDTVIKEAKEQKKPFKDHYTHLLVHGCLHLAGYNHESDADADEMESLEISILDSLNIQNPYLDKSQIA